MVDEHTVSLQPGTVIGGKYEVVRCLGSGSMGMVYACRHRELQGQLVAAKVLFSEVALDQVAAARFKNEILASYGVSHPNVVRAYEFIKEGELVAYTMEFVGGGDLADRMSSSTLMGITEIVRLLSQMTAGVQAIHDAGIVHRDLKPENILLTNEGTVKIADFGIARQKNGPKLTEHGGVVGTIEYVAPEYMLKSQVDWRSDIYALGILAFELLTGEAPFRGESAYASISKRLQSDPESPSKYRSECPPELDAVILKALRRDPEARYQSATEMFYDLQEVATKLGIADITGAGILIPPRSAVVGKRYVGPSLSGQSEGSNKSPETQLLTSDGSIEYMGDGESAHNEWEAQASSSVLGSDARPSAGRTSRSDTQVIPISQSHFGAASGVGSATRQDPYVDNGITASREPLVAGGRLQRDQRYVPQDFPSSIVEKSNQRLKRLDSLIFIFAALSGVGFGYVFLRLFAPAFLEKLSFLGGGS
jgi:serine/threonine protein kinase